MALDPNEAAKRAFIAYQQLNEIVKNDIGVSSAKAHLDSYNRILEVLTQCFSIDPAFKDAISHLHALTHRGIVGAMDAGYQMESDGRVLLATARSFIELYLSPEEKKKTIGFHG
jgi:hypothetical protein